MLITKFWTRKFCNYLSQTLGFSKPWGNFPFKRQAELVGMRMYGLLEREKCSRELFFDNLRGSSGTSKYNRDLMKQRKRMGFKCPQDYKHECWKCHVGYDKCPVATHPRTYVKEECGVCEQVLFHDPRNLEMQTCIKCQIAKDLAGD